MLNFLKNVYFLYLWYRNDFIGGRPKFIKNKILKHYHIRDSAWIETGTYRGETTKFLSSFSPFVHSIEPDNKLYQKASERFKKYPNIEIHHGTSEEILPQILKGFEDDCNFWLDGHYSGENTYLGEKHYPITEELEAIQNLMAKEKNVTIFIDDVDNLLSFSEKYISETDLKDVIRWAENNKCNWIIENNIMIISNKKPNA